MQKRHTAVKLWISDIVNGKYFKQDGEFEPNYIETRGKRVSRVSIIANVTFKFQSEDGNYVGLSVDDGSSVIRLKSWREDVELLKSINIGDIILVIGRVKEFNNEIYINPEIVRVLDNLNWELVRKLELLKEYGKFNIVKQESNHFESVEIVENVSENSRQTILSIIERLGADEGAKIDDVIVESKLSEEKVESVVQELLREGEIYENRPGRLMVIN